MFRLAVEDALGYIECLGFYESEELCIEAASDLNLKYFYIEYYYVSNYKMVRYKINKLCLPLIEE